MTSASISHEPLLDDLEAAQRSAELHPLLAVGQGGVVGGDGVPERTPGTRTARGDQHATGVLERLGCRQARRVRHAHAVEPDLGLPDRAGRRLAGDRDRLEARHVLLDEEALDLAVVLRARPHDHDVGDRSVADPALGAVEHPVVAVAARARLQCDGVRSVGGLSERERPDRLETRHRRQPARLLLLGAEQRDGLHRESGLHAEERAEAAVATMQLHVDETAGERAHPRAAVTRMSSP